MNIGERLKEIRTARKLSVYKLSKDADVSENFIRSVEKGKSQPSVYVLEKILKSLGMSIPEFFSIDSEAIYPSEFELQLLKYVRILPEEKADMVLAIAKMFSK